MLQYDIPRLSKNCSLPLVLLTIGVLRYLLNVFHAFLLGCALVKFFYHSMLLCIFQSLPLALVWEEFLL